MITIITYISIISGSILILQLLLSLLGGLDLDFDVDLDLGDTDTDTDAGGLGVIKSGLTFISVCLWVVRIFLLLNWNPYLAAMIGIGSGLIAVVLLTWMLRALLKNEVNVNWHPEDAVAKMAKVYLRIPKTNGSGIIQLNIKGANRELKAITKDGLDIATGEQVFVEDYQDGFAIVSKFENK